MILSWSPSRRQLMITVVVELSDAECIWKSPQELERPSLELDILNTERTQKVRDMAGHLGCNWSPRHSLATHAMRWQCTASFRLWKWLSMERSKLACPSLCSTVSLQSLYNLDLCFPSHVQTTCSVSLGCVTSMRPKKQEQKDWDQIAVFRWKDTHLKHCSTPFCVTDCRTRRWWRLKHIHIHWQEAEFIRYTPNPNAHQPCFSKQKVLTWLRFRFDSGFNCLRFQNLWLRPGYTPNCREHILVAAFDVQEHHASAVLGRSTRALTWIKLVNLSVYSTGGSSLASCATTANNAKERVIKLVERQVDPFQPPKFKHKTAPGGEGFAHGVALWGKGRLFALYLKSAHCFWVCLYMFV